MIYIIPTSTVSHLLPHIKDDNFYVIKPETNKDKRNIFPDGEVYVRIPKAKEIRSDRIVVIHAGSPSPNNGLIELEMILSVLKRSNVSNVEVFFTYFPYGMQDKVFEEGETNASEDLFRKLVEYYKVKKVFAIEPHFHSEPWVKNYPFVSVSAHEIMTDATKKDFPDAVFIAPDLGHERRTNIKGFKKTRADSYNVTIHHDENFMKSLSGKVVGVTDDIIETGGTMANFYNELAKYKPKQIFAVATHGIMESGIKRIKEKYGNLFLSNTVECLEANVDMSGLILQSLK